MLQFRAVKSRASSASKAGLGCGFKTFILKICDFWSGDFENSSTVLAFFNKYRVDHGCVSPIRLFRGREGFFVRGEEWGGGGFRGWSVRGLVSEASGDCECEGRGEAGGEDRGHCAHSDTLGNRALARHRLSTPGACHNAEHCAGCGGLEPVRRCESTRSRQTSAALPFTPQGAGAVQLADITLKNEHT